MTRDVRRRADDASRGQVMVMFALGFTTLMLVSALAIDVSRAYSTLRFYRSAADAAALAAAQDLQVPGTRSVPADAYVAARMDALAALASRFGAAPPACSPAADIVDCHLPGTPVRVTIKSPSPTCVTCDPVRSVQVQVRNPEFVLTAAQLAGHETWELGVASVAGLTHRGQYAVVTLRPPRTLGHALDVDNIEISGTGTVLRVTNGDIGTNANAVLDGLGATIALDPGFLIHRFHDPAGWSGPPRSRRIPRLIADPGYSFPSFAGAPIFNNASTSPAQTRADQDATCAAELLKLDPTAYPFAATTALNKVYCYNPGIYASANNNARIVVGTGELALLKPGAYYLRRGADIGGRLIGGYQSGQPGVVLVFDECSNVQCNFTGNNATGIALNAGTAFPPGTGGVSAAPALDWAGNAVVATGESLPSAGVLMTLMVHRDPTCSVPTSAPFRAPVACSESANQTLTMAGGGSLALSGIQYAPSDNITITGGSSGYGDVGQLIAWTIRYAGGTRVNQTYAGSGTMGVVRIDAACSAISEPCNP